jgi:hypothetical protein
MGRAGRCTFQGLSDDFFDALVVNLPWSARPRFIEKTVDTTG